MTSDIQEILKDLHTDTFALLRMELAGKKAAVLDRCVNMDSVFRTCGDVFGLTGLQIVGMDEVNVASLFYALKKTAPVRK